ncbi:methyl-accepting chemotaxis protein [Tamilnaduibacter salinus]|uniref:Methyl-accepting chemotaxis protein n=1 Tax=Tamilnaduibacter salinus TaxID=1484056 RepID=A0A2U1CZF1_9GAMM|nr:methyl-accepting chemotaxis protein [Tamilnaduibacter salinus]
MLRMKSISRQVLLIILLVNIVVAGVAGSYLTYSLRVADDFSEVTSRDIQGALEAQVVLANFKTQVQEWKNVLLRGHNRDDREKYWSQFKDQEAVVQDHVEEMLPLITDEESKQLLERFAKAHRRMGDAYREGYQRFVDSGFDHTAGDSAVRGIDREPAALINEATQRIAKLSREKANTLESSARSNTMLAGTGLLAAVILGTIVSVVIINRQVIRPTVAISSQLEQLGEGDLGQKSTIHRADELGRLADAARKLHDFLNEIKQTTQTNAADLATIKETITTGAHDIADKSTQAHERIDQMAAAMNEMSSTANEVAQHAASVSTRVDETTSETGLADQNIATSVDSMGRLSEQIRATSETVTTLAESNKKVSSVMEVIREIADQTNLLALNAAIEAARAGDAGRGFSVVADEVRSLAGKTQEATVEIDAIVSSIASGSEQATQYMQTSESVTDDCVQQVSEVQRIVKDINERMSEIREATTQVATAAEEQTSVSEDISQNITEIANLSEDMSQASKSNLKTIPELEAMASTANNLAHRIRG